MMGILLIYLVVGQHPKIHSASEDLMLYIQHHPELQKHLAPSLHMTRSLHTMLLETVFSPMSDTFTPWSWFYRLTVIKNSTVSETKNWKEFTHEGLLVVRNRKADDMEESNENEAVMGSSNSQIPLAKFLRAARASCMKHTKEIGLPPHLRELFFLHTVVHSIDHTLAHLITRHLVFPALPYHRTPEYTPTRFRDRLISSGFRNFFVDATPSLTSVADTLQSLRTDVPMKGGNLMRDMPKDSVYGKVYRDLLEVNEYLAGVVCGSIMY
ncbi:hypothetical protein BC829DRAFT_189463 [Chytridium lagenaria]|nr:hypothetical protein BC829DRAFT_189463 [Chytridium lagenaria]